jgi:aminomethyltransferase
MKESDGVRETPFLAFHRELGAKIVEFAGWSMPVQYSSILKEHGAVRSGAGLFDVSHMARFEIGGGKALSFVQNLTTNDASKLTVGMVQYSAFCNDEGGILDDVTVYRLPRSFLIVVNAANAGKIRSWISQHVRDGVEFRDRTDDIAQLAVQGPRSQSVLQRVASFDLDGIGFYRFGTGEVAGMVCTVSRTGYTGEDGFEIYLPAPHAATLWRALMDGGELTPCGLGARDILRLEVKYCLYGNDIDETTSPLEAGLGWIVKFDKGDFVGRRSLLEQKERGLTRKLAAFGLLGKGIPRPGYPILRDQRVVSKVASGGYSPSIDRGIGTAYLPVGLCDVKTEIEVEIRGNRLPAEVVTPPFYKAGSRR